MNTCTLLTSDVLFSPFAYSARSLTTPSQPPPKSFSLQILPRPASTASPPPRHSPFSTGPPPPPPQPTTIFHPPSSSPCWAVVVAVAIDSPLLPLSHLPLKRDPTAPLSRGRYPIGYIDTPYSPLLYSHLALWASLTLTCLLVLASRTEALQTWRSCESSLDTFTQSFHPSCVAEDSRSGDRFQVGLERGSPCLRLASSSSAPRARRCGKEKVLDQLSHVLIV